MSSNILQEKFTTVFIIASLALITIILLWQVLDINVNFSFGVKTSLKDINQSLNDIKQSINNLQQNIENRNAMFNQEGAAALSDFSKADFSQEDCNLEGLTDEDIQNLTDEELNALCPALAR
jgi:hypothetical protein